MGFTHSPTTNWASPRVTRAHTTQSSCISGRPVSRVAAAQSSAATQHNRDVFWRRQRRTTASANGAWTKPQQAKRTVQQVPPQQESRNPPHPRLLRFPMMSSSDAPPKEPQVPDSFKGPVPMELILEALTLHLPYFFTEAICENGGHSTDTRGVGTSIEKTRKRQHSASCTPTCRVMVGWFSD